MITSGIPLMDLDSIILYSKCKVELVKKKEIKWPIRLRIELKKYSISIIIIYLKKCCWFNQKSNRTKYQIPKYID